MGALYFWIDLIWIPVGLFMVEKHQRVWLSAFFIANMVMMRLLAELIGSTGFKTGMLPFMTSHAFDRALVVYSIYYALFLVIAHYSPNSDKHVFLAASISVFFIAAVTAVIVMVL